MDRVGAEIDRIERNLRVRINSLFRKTFIFKLFRKNILIYDMWI